MTDPVRTDSDDKCQMCGDKSVHVQWLPVGAPCPEWRELTERHADTATLMHLHACRRHFHVHLCEDCYATGALEALEEVAAIKPATVEEFWQTYLPESLAARFAHDHGPATGALWS